MRQAAADEIYVQAPVLMVVEPESLCRMPGQLSSEAGGEAWTRPLSPLESLEQVTRDAGKGLGKGAEQVDAARRAQGRPGVADQLDHFHTVREGNRALRKTASKARRAFERAEAAQKALEKRRVRGLHATAAGMTAGRMWKRAERAMDR